MAGVKAWSVFGDIRLSGLSETMSKITAFNSAGAIMSKNMRGWHRNSLILAGGIGGVALATGAVATVGVRNFAQFDAAMTQSLAIMGDVSDAMRNEMEQAARDVARATLFSAKQAAESYFFLASAGLDAEQSIAALPQVAAFAQAGMFDMALATDLATDAQSALGLTVDDAQQNLRNLTRVTDVLVRANTLANASVQQFATALTSEAGAALKTVGKDIEEGAAVLAAFADQGVKAEKAGTGLSRIIRLMSAAAVKNAAAYEELNVEVFDSAGEMRNFADIVEDLEDALGPMSDETRAMALEMLGFRARVQGVILPLLGTSDAIRRYEAELRTAAGATEEVADKQLLTLTNQWELLKAEIGDATISLGDFLVEATDAPGVLAAMREGIVDTREAFQDWTRDLRIVKFELDQVLDRARDPFGVLADAQAQAAEQAARAARRPFGGPMPLPGTRPLFPTPGQRFVGPGPGFQQVGGDAGGASLRTRLALEKTLAEMRATNRRLRMLVSGGGIGRATPVDRALPGRIDALTGSSAISRGVPVVDLSDDIEPMVDEYQAELARQMSEAATETESDILPSFEALGADLIRGLVSGSFSAEDFLRNAFITLASNAILGPLGAALGIASPSRLTAEMGRQLVFGLEAGIMEASAAGGVARAWGHALRPVSTSGLRRAAGSITPGMRLDLTGMPPAGNPLAQVRDREWQEFLRASDDHARRDGHRR